MRASPRGCRCRTCEVGLHSRYAAIAFLLHFWFYSHLAALNNLVL